MGAVVRWLDDDEMRAWRALLDVTNDVRASLEHELSAEHGLTEGDYAVLVALSEAADRRLRMCDLAALLHLSPSGLTRRLDGLVKAGFVTREAAADDRRVTLAVLTPAGFAKLSEAAPDHVDGVRRHFLDHLTRAQLRELTEALLAVQRRRAATATPGAGSGRVAARS
jgi:DNA-binding MarR family transcriptional regulator